MLQGTVNMYTQVGFGITRVKNLPDEYPVHSGGSVYCTAEVSHGIMSSEATQKRTTLSTPFSRNIEFKVNEVMGILENWYMFAAVKLLSPLNTHWWSPHRLGSSFTQ